MEKSKMKQERKILLIMTAIFVSTVASVALFTFLYGFGTAELIRNTVTVGIGSGIVLFLMAQSKESDLFDYDNGNYYERFFIGFLSCLLLAISCGKLPAAGWPFVPVFVLLALFSNSIIGICAGSLFLMISILLSGAGMGIYFLYFISGVSAVCIFRKLDASYKVGIPTVVSLLVLVVCETAEVILFENAKLSVESFIIPMMNVIITAILLIAILKIFSYLVIYKYRDRYMEINDQQCPLLVKLKDKSKDEYYKAVHTAYLSDKIARKLDLNDQVAKACGYYHRIGCLLGENTWENAKQICEEYQFPPEVYAVLEEYGQKDGNIIIKETAILYFADTVIDSILCLIAQDKNAKLDYDRIIDGIFDQKVESKRFKECLLTIREFNQMKKIFKEEKLYYDFLR